MSCILKWIWIYMEYYSIHFLDASMHLYKRLCPSVCPPIPIVLKSPKVGKIRPNMWYTLNIHCIGALSVHSFVRLSVSQLVHPLVLSLVLPPDGYIVVCLSDLFGQVERCFFLGGTDKLAFIWTITSNKISKHLNFHIDELLWVFFFWKKQGFLKT